MLAGTPTASWPTAGTGSGVESFAVLISASEHVFKVTCGWAAAVSEVPRVTGRTSVVSTGHSAALLSLDGRCRVSVAGATLIVHVVVTCRGSFELAWPSELKGCAE